MTFTDLVVRYLERPSRESFRDVRAAVRGAPNFMTDFNAEVVVRDLISQRNYGEVIARLSTFMPGAFMSPSTHALLALAHRQLGNLKEAEREELLGRVALQGIFGTGDGSFAAPWQVLRISDEYDVLKVLGKRPARQEALIKEGSIFDHHICEDGSELWFDLSLLYGVAR